MGEIELHLERGNRIDRYCDHGLEMEQDDQMERGRVEEGMSEYEM